VRPARYQLSAAPEVATGPSISRGGATGSNADL